MIIAELAATIVAFALLNVMYKVSDVHKCDKWVFLAGLYATGAAASLFGLTRDHSGAHVPTSVIVMGVVGGAAAMLCLLCYLAALRRGAKLSVVTIMVAMSLAVPVLYSVIFQGESLSLPRVLGLLLFVVFLLLLNEPKRADGKGGAR